MSNGNSNNAAMFTAIGFFVLAAGATAFAVMSRQTANQLRVEKDDQAAAASEANTTRNNLVKDTDALKDKLGYTGEIGAVKSGPDTVLARIEADLQRYGASEAQGTVEGTLRSMRTELTARSSRITDLERSNAELDQRLRALEKAYQDKVAEYEAARTEAERQLRNVESETDTLVAQKEDRIRSAEATTEQAVSEKTRIQRTLSDEIEELEDVIRNYETRIDFLGRELADRKAESFERADGKVISADPDQRLVYINLGDRDSLPTQTTFSVYKKNHYGIGRGLEDVKGAVEVIRIIGPHFAEARVLEEDNSNPIGAGDYLYSPLWQAGQTNYFSFIGELDIDGDGQDDRNLLFNKVRDAGGEIELYVDMDGQRYDGQGQVAEEKKLSSRTKYLILGDLPDPTTVPTQSKEYDQLVELSQRRLELEKEARQQGIQIVNLPDFLSQLGYVPTQRIFVPGKQKSAENLGERRRGRYSY